MKLKFIDIKKYGFVVEPRYFFYGWAKSPKILARKSLVKALIKARRFLPKGWNFKIWDCQRPRIVNELMIKNFWRRINQAHPRLSSKEIKKLVVRFAGPAPSPKIETKIWTHRNGGAIDLTIINKKGEELYLGTDFDDLTEKAAADYFERKKNLNIFEKEAKKNRRLLKRVMEKAGFGSYKYEWWHWSYDE